ncbi:hypothetical protein CKK33_17445 [Mucilaginibacter sp. MD40]|uniref:hypothetical protein n=1 Tax=Mucilaginibacter sp. MD40 TaxID=2029590 RepID=UPI000BACE103|nr:hypothetical protein [Mucilaginibacter sp. MD40]PAW95187.1 hypothetical protein CKK33_17445 [Mucilaginibacter sp. MD40]
MKNFKQVAFGLLVGALAIGFSSFTNAPKKLATDWYEPLSSTLSPSSTAAQQFSSYDGDNPIDQPSCSGTTNVCAAEFPVTTNPPTHISTKN